MFYCINSGKYIGKVIYFIKIKLRNLHILKKVQVYKTTWTGLGVWWNIRHMVAFSAIGYPIKEGTVKEHSSSQFSNREIVYIFDALPVQQLFQKSYWYPKSTPCNFLYRFHFSHLESCILYNWTLLWIQRLLKNSVESL